MYDKIISLGYNCNVTFLLGHNNLKKESSLFEWFETKNFSDIIDVIEKFSDKYNDIENYEINIKPTHKSKGVIIEKNSIYSAHYNIDNFREIFNRRCKRFFNDIIKSKNLLFIRVKNYNIISKVDIVRFEKIIRNINPNLEKINILLIDSLENGQNKIHDYKDYDIMLTRYIKMTKNSNTFKDFYKNLESIEQFSVIMKEFGYEKNISKYKKNDKI
jgi:hypothetical protein